MTFPGCGQVYMLVHTSKVKVRGLQEQGIEKIDNDLNDTEANKSPKYPLQNLSETSLPNVSLDGPETQHEYETSVHANEDENMEDQGIGANFDVEKKIVNGELSDKDFGDVSEKTRAGAIWDVFRRRDVPKLVEYIRVHWKEFGKPDCVLIDPVIFHPYSCSST